MCRNEEKPAPTSSMASRMPCCAQRPQDGSQCVVVLDLVVLGQLQQHAVERQPGSSSLALRGEQGGR